MRHAEPEALGPVEALQGSSGKYSYALPDGSRVHTSTSAAAIYINRDKNATLQPESWVIYGGAIPFEEGGPIEGITVQEADARAQIFDMLEAMGIDYMGIATVERARLAQYDTTVISKGYEFVLTRIDGGSVALDLDYGDYDGLVQFAWESYEAYSEKWEMERMSVYVDETGIRAFAWKHPLSVTGELNQNVPLMPFEEMQERIKQTIKVGLDRSGARDLNNPDWTFTFTVDRIVLSHLMVPAKNQSGYQLYQPAWLIFHTFSAECHAGLYIGQGYTDEGMFALNAIDGSIIYTSRAFEG